jgi:hypothetical protein
MIGSKVRTTAAALRAAGGLDLPPAAGRALGHELDAREHPDVALVYPLWQV